MSFTTLEILNQVSGQCETPRKCWSEWFGELISKCHKSDTTGSGDHVTPLTYAELCTLVALKFSVGCLWLEREEK